MLRSVVCMAALVAVFVGWGGAVEGVGSDPPGRGLDSVKRGDGHRSRFDGVDVDDGVVNCGHRRSIDADEHNSHDSAAVVARSVRIAADAESVPDVGVDRIGAGGVVWIASDER